MQTRNSSIFTKFRLLSASVSQIHFGRSCVLLLTCVPANCCTTNCSFMFVLSNAVISIFTLFGSLYCRVLYLSSSSIRLSSCSQNLQNSSGLPPVLHVVVENIVLCCGSFCLIANKSWSSTYPFLSSQQVVSLSSVFILTARIVWTHHLPFVLGHEWE